MGTRSAWFLLLHGRACLLPAASTEEWVPCLVLVATGAALDSAAWMAVPSGATLAAAFIHAVVGVHLDSSWRNGMEDLYGDIRLA